MPVAPSYIKEAAKRALKAREQVPPSRKAGTPVGLARANQLANGVNLSVNTLVRMRSYLERAEPAYDEAILSLSKFVELNPNHPLIPYAIYLKAYSYFERIPDINLDQKFSTRAYDEFSELINRYPKSKYARKSKKHITKLKNHLAAKEIKVGKFYQSKGDYLAAIKRYKIVLKQYRKSKLVSESIYRLIESYVALGLVKQSYYLYKILEFNFPKSKWKKEGLILVEKYKLNKNLKKYKKKQLDLEKLKPLDLELI